MPEPRAFAADDVFDTLRVGIRAWDVINSHWIDAYSGGEVVSRLWPQNEGGDGSYPPALFAVMDTRHESGTVVVEYDTHWGVFREDAVPAFLQPHVDFRDPFRRVRTLLFPELTTVQRRRLKVTDWARANTQPRAFAKGAIDAWEHRGTTRPKVVIWWHFVLMTVAAAQHDAWLEDEDVWPAIERNIQIDMRTFIDQASEVNWNEPARYMEALSRVYRAGEYLSTAPTWVQLIPPALSNLHAGAAEAKRIVYGDI